MARRGYVQLVNGFYANEKVQELARSGRMDAVGVFCMALTYCGDHLTDGFVPRRAMLYVIGATGEQVNALCDVGMLEAVDEGWLLHDYTAPKSRYCMPGRKAPSAWPSIATNPM